MTATTFSHVSPRAAAHTAPAATTRPSVLAMLGDALSAARAVRTASARDRVTVAARFAARV